MAIERFSGKYGRYLVLSALVAAFIATVSAEGYCVDFNVPIYSFEQIPSITIDPGLAYAGQTITIRGSGFNTTPYPGDQGPVVYCNAFCDEHGTLVPIKLQSDGSFVIQPAPKATGTAEIYAWDKWGNQSNKVALTVTEPVTFSVAIYDGTHTPYVSNGVLCIRYPATANTHYENSLIGSTYTTKMAFNGTSAEIWVRQSPLTTDHKTIQNIQAGQAYSVSLTMPVNTSSPTAQATTATPTQNPQATLTVSTAPSISGTPDTTAPVTTLSLTGVKGTDGIFTSNVVCTLTVVDEGGSGVNNTQYSFDGNVWTTYAGPFAIATPGNTSVFYRSTDLAGNRELTRVEAVTIAGPASATASVQQNAGCWPFLVLPFLAAGLAGAYRVRKGRQK